jgi:hypothetical protein
VKTLYLHIGTTKTGTSSIQEFLSQNREVLMQQGYCFPEALRKYPHVCSNRNAHFLIANYFLEDGSHDTALEEGVLLEGMEQFAHCFEKYDNVILTDEAIWRVSSRGRKNLFPYLLEDSMQKGYTVKIVVYLRRQDAYMISNWNQNVKHCTSQHRSATLEERLDQIVCKEKYVVNYADKLDKMAAVFGKENLIVRRYEPDSWYHGSIIEDFMHAIGLEVTEDYLPLTKMINPSLQGNTIEIQRILNKDPSFTTNECIYLGTFLRELAPESGRRYPCAMLSQEEIRELLHKFEKGNERVATEYIQDGKPLFSDEIKDLPKWQADNPYMMEDVIRFFSAVSIDLRRENAALRKETEALRKELSQLQTTVKNEQQNLRTFKYKVKHPLRALWARLFHRNA